MAILRPLSRRSFGRALAGAVFAPWRAVQGSDWLAWEPESAPALNLEQRYRADAQVLLLGLPLLRREGVGAGSVVWREFENGSPARLLEFTGYSAPERAAGLNRMGFIRELARISPDAYHECIYFGLMTASPEESAEEARKSLHSTAKEQAYTAIEGRIGGDAIETAVAHFTAPAEVSGERSAELAERARYALMSAQKITTPVSVGASSPSFLQALAGLLQRSNGEEGRYIYSGRPYRMRVSRARDERATEYFKERGMLAVTGQAVRISGRVWREAGGKETDFHLWIADGAEKPMPLRIEYQPKSYLRLIFEAVAPVSRRQESLVGN